VPTDVRLLVGGELSATFAKVTLEIEAARTWPTAMVKAAIKNIFPAQDFI
jgi:hypothetical protein